MPYTKTKQDRNLGGSKSQNNQKSKHPKYDSPPKLEKISKYFSATLKEDNQRTPKASRSQSDLDDFKTPIAINKISKIRNKKPINCTKKRKTIKNETNSLKRFIETNMRQSDVNPDHLQLALALSESSYQAEHPEQYLSSQEKTESFRKAFEKFGFGYGKNKTTRNKDFFEITKLNRNKKSRYRYVTPILKMRTLEQRQNLIKEKIDAILAYNERKVAPFELKNNLELFSNNLKEYHLNKIFSLNYLSGKELNEKFRIDRLNLDWSGSCCGCLLKDWSKIQGRDSSPIRELTSVGQGNLNTMEYSGRSFSPDLFESDDEYPNTNLEIGAYCKGENSIIGPHNSESEDLISNEAEFARFENYPSGGRSEKSKSPKKFETTSLYHQTEDNFSTSFFSNNLKPTKTNITSNQIFNDKSQTTNKRDYKSSENDVYDLTQSDSEDINLDSYDKNKKNSEKYLLSSDDEITDYHDYKSLNTPDEEILSTQMSLRLKYSFDEKSPIGCSINIEDNVRKTCYTEAIINNHTLDSSSSDEDIDPTRIATRKEPFSPLTQESLRFKYSFDEELRNDGINSPPTDIDSGLQKVCNNDSLELLSSDEEGGCRAKKELSYTFNNKQACASFSSSATIDDQVQRVEDINNCQTFPHDLSLDQTELYEVNDYDLNNIPSLQNSNSLKKLSTSESQETFSQESIELSDEELNYSSNCLNIGEDVESLIDSPPPCADSYSEKLKSANETPKSNKDFIIKMNNITPMPDYDQMNTPEIRKHLDKYGLKPLKRTKGVKMLRYIYDTTHPLVKDDDGKIIKKRKTISAAKIQIAEHLSKESDLIFERSQSKRIHSCRVPLHIVWYNFIANNPHIRESILFYEPLQLEVLHASLKEQGFKFNIQDLLRFLDRKCITIRTNQSAHHKKKS